MNPRRRRKLRLMRTERRLANALAVLVELGRAPAGFLNSERVRRFEELCYIARTLSIQGRPVTREELAQLARHMNREVIR